MNVIQENLACPSELELGGVDRQRKWFLALGILTILFGLIAISMPVIATFAAIFSLGFLLLVSGAFQLFQSLRAQRGRHFILHLIMGILYIITGIVMIVNPFVGAASLALFMASFFVLTGIFRISWSAVTRFRNWGWVLFNGIVTLLLGILIFSGWPVSGLWLIGFFLGIEMILYGWTLAMFAAAEQEEIRQMRLRCAPSYEI